jgi:hypothetical protein
MAITWANVVLIAPEQAAITNTAVQAALLAVVEAQIEPTVWTDFADGMDDIARAWLAAHYGALWLRNGDVAGALTQQTLGPMSESYALPPGVYGALATTKYGLEYQRLAQLLPVSLGFVP